MPKTRRPANRRGAKSISKRIKFKIGGRKSEKSALDLTKDELLDAIQNWKGRGRDLLKLLQVKDMRGW